MEVLLQALGSNKPLAWIAGAVLSIIAFSVLKGERPL
jgi:hypothetical protein